jgi:hypothetical protein
VRLCERMCVKWMEEDSRIGISMRARVFSRGSVVPPVLVSSATVSRRVRGRGGEGEGEDEDEERSASAAASAGCDERKSQGP